MLSQQNNINNDLSHNTTQQAVLQPVDDGLLRLNQSKGQSTQSELRKRQVSFDATHMENASSLAGQAVRQLKNLQANMTQPP